MHRPWSNIKTLTDLLNDKQPTVWTFLEMIDNRQLPLYVLTEYNRTVMYSQQYVHECLTKEGTSTKPELDTNNMNGDDLEQESHCEHSCHISADNTSTVNNRLGKATSNTGLYHDWSKNFYTGTRAENMIDSKFYTGYLRKDFYKQSDDKLKCKQLQFLS